MIVGVDIGATKTLLTAAAADNAPREQRFPTPADFTTFTQQLDQHLREITDHHDPAAVVVAAPGVIEDGVLRRGGQLSWVEADIRTAITSLYPQAGVEVLNDAAAGGWYEAVAGTGKDYNVVLYVTISTGIGTSLIIDQQLRYDFGNSEGGRMVYDPNTAERFEAAASGKSFTETYHHQGAEESDPTVWSEYGSRVGTCLFSMATLVRPQAIVIGGSMGAHWEQYRSAALSQFDTLNAGMFQRPVIVAASQPETAVAAGCLQRARELADG